ncbi:MAG: TonB-dependent receptor [Chitinophagaceae bacterium]
MKHFSILITTLLLFAFNYSFSQINGQIKGEIKDKNKIAIQAASVSLLKFKDSSLVKTTITDKDGKYRFDNINSDTFLVSASAVGYANLVSEKLFLREKQTSITLTSFEMKEQANTLGAVTVTAQKPMIEIKADKTVLNVAGSVNAVGSTAMELLEKSPGVRVDKDDNISMNGKNGVRIYIDGKPSQMDGKDLAAILKGIPSSDIEAIEIISNPSAKYDASGNAGIINIRLVKNKNVGLNGNAALTTSFGNTPKYNGSIALNSRSKYVNVFGNYSYFTGDRRNTLDIYREQSNNGKLNTFDQQSKMIDDNNNNNFKAGADFFINKKNTFGVMINGSRSSGVWENLSKTFISSQNQKIDSILVASNRINQKRNNFNYNANYRYADTSGRELNIDADYGAFDSKANSYQPNKYTSADGKTIFNEKNYRSNTVSNIDIYSLKADYEQKLWGGKLGTGAKISRVRSNNDYAFFNVIENVDRIDTNQTNLFKYKEDVNAAYVNFNKTIKKWSFQFGVRMEQTHASGDLIALKGESGKKVDTSYLNFFPSGGVTMNINKSNSLGVTYSRRIDRPSYQDLNPFEYKLDELTYQKGNPFLRPQYTNNIQLIHTFKQFLTTSIGYSHVKDFFTEVSDTSGGSKTFITNKNIAVQNIYSINIAAPLRIKKWWNGYASINAFHSEFKGHLDNGDLNVSSNSFSVYMQHNFTLSKNYSTEVTGFYNATNLEGTMKSNTMWKVDWGVQKKVFDQKGTVKLSVNDVFNSMKWSGSTNFGGVNMKLANRWESQQLKLAFTYRFGNKNVKSARERNTGLEDEQRRIKGGN